MTRPTPKAFADLLQSAVREPGILSRAYAQFHSYSIGNQLLAMMQCHQRGIEPGVTLRQTRMTGFSQIG